MSSNRNTVKRSANPATPTNGQPPASRGQPDIRPHAADERLQAAERCLGFGMWDWDLNSGEIRWTAGMEAIYGISPKNFGGDPRAFFQVVHPDDRAYCEQSSRDILTGPPSFEVEFRIVRPDGDVRWVKSKGIVQRDTANAAQRVIGCNIDITDNKHVGDALTINEARLNTALHLSELLIFHQDRQLRYTWIANPAFGTRPEDLIGRSDVDILGEAAARPLVEIKERVLQTGRGERQELWVSLGDQRGCYDLIVEPERSANGEVTGIVCAAADITRRKLAESERDAANASLSQLVDRVQDRIEEQRREIAREVHDQIGATLTGIRMRLETLSQRPSSQALADIRAEIDLALASTRTLCSRLRPPILDDLGLAETIRWYVRDWSKQTGLKAGARISAFGGEPGEPLRTDLFRMLQELLTNVARHAGAHRVTVSLGQVHKSLQLRVRDDGKGFPPGTLRGFGLLGIHERLRRHGGEIVLERNKPGASVRIRIPLERS